MTQANIPAPDLLCPPFGQYSHALFTPPGARLLHISGQVGVRPDGVTPAGLAEQAAQTFENIASILKANQLGFEHVVKLTTFIVAGHSIADVRAVRAKYLGQARPCSTAIFVAGLAGPEWLIEIEAIAAAPAA